MHQLVGMKWANCVTTLVVATALISFAPAAHAQSPAGDIRGVVVDQTGSPLADVPVTIISNETGLRRELHTDNEGRFTAPALRVGTYEVTAARQGLATRRQESLPVNVGRTSWVRLELTPAAEPETITIADIPTVTERTRSHMARAIERVEIENLPANGLQFLDLTLSLPGVMRDVDTGEIFIAGRDAGMNRVVVDGGDPMVLWSPLGMSGAPVPYFLSRDAVQEFRVDVNGARADSGAAGSTIHVVTKSGTNQFRGIASTSYESSRRESSRSRRSNQFAGTFGGPIARDRHFFFVNTDSWHASRPFDDDQNLFLVSTDHQLAGAQRVMFRFNEQPSTGASDRSARSLGSTLTTVFGSSVVNDVRVYGGHARLSPVSPITYDRVQAADTLTLVAAAHEIKGGFDTRLDEPVFGDVRATSVFLQDEWQATPAVTLNVGVRRDDQFVTHWNPRVGATWLRSGGRVLVRGNYGMFSGAAPWLITSREDALAVAQLHVRQAGGGVEWEWMPQATAAVDYIDSSSDVQSYRALTLEVHRRFWQNLGGRFAYTAGWLTNANGSRALEDHRHRVVQSVIYSTRGLADRFDGWKKSLAKDWMLSAVLTAQSGRGEMLTYMNVDPHIARNIDLGGNRRLSVIYEAFNFRERPNYLVAATPFPVSAESPIEPKLSQFSLRFSF